MSQPPIPAAAKPQVVVIGSFQRGKSTLINGLIGHPVAEIGDGMATTQDWTRFRASPSNGCVEAVSPAGEVLYTWPNVTAQILKHVDLIDTPGFGTGGPDGLAREAAANEALAKADVVLFMANQTGLGGAAERDVLSQVSQHQTIVITLQNVFVSSSLAKKAAWLALLEKQVADIGVFAWRLHLGNRALSINALQLTEYTDANATATHAVTATGITKKPHNLDTTGIKPLIVFLSGQDPTRLGATDLCHLRSATNNWIHHRTQRLVHHLEIFLKPCL